MKLAQALIHRADLNKKIAQLSSRLDQNARVQEGDPPSEDPTTLLRDLSSCTAELERLIVRINVTNVETVIDGVSLAALLARREVKKMTTNILRSFVECAREINTRYSNAEIKMVSTINVAETQKQVDHHSRDLRELDLKIQEYNWTTDLIE